MDFKANYKVTECEAFEPWLTSLPKYEIYAGAVERIGWKRDYYLCVAF